MIKVEKGAVEIRGSIPELMTDVTIVLRAVREVITDRGGEEVADKMMQHSIDLYKKTDEEIMKEAMSDFGRLLQKMFS